MKLDLYNSWDDLYLIPTICLWWRTADINRRWWITFYFISIRFSFTWLQKLK